MCVVRSQEILCGRIHRSGRRLGRGIFRHDLTDGMKQINPNFDRHRFIQCLDMASPCECFMQVIGVIERGDFDRLMTPTTTNSLTVTLQPGGKLIAYV
jgi:hypothetical protein